MRKTALVASAALFGVVVAGCGGSSTADDADSLTVVMWGGAAQEAHVASYIQPFADEKNLTVKQDSPTDYAKLKAQVESGKVSWGLVEVEPNFASSACEQGLLEKLPDEVKQAATTANVDPQQMGDCAIPILQYSLNIGYNTDAFPDAHPTTWAEFFDTEKFPGKRAFWKYATGGIFEAALLADGVAPADLYPLDIDRALKKLDTIKDDIIWYDTGDQQVQLLASGEAPLVQAWNGRLTQAAAEGQKVANEYGESLISYDQIVIPKGYANAGHAQEWMSWFLANADAQAQDAVASGYSPVTPAALDLVPADKRAELINEPTNLAKSAITMDYVYWAEHYDEVTETLNAWIAG